jgi:uncharacterized membrane protein YoaK (UPF0700 family)
MKPPGIAALMSFNGGFVDTAGFFGLQGLFTAHVTGNFVMLAATLIMGTHGVIAKLLALPEFVLIVALARIVGSALRVRGLPALRILLTAKVGFLLAFFVTAVTLGPFPDSDAPAALLAAFAGVAGMAVQNAVQRVHFANIPPTTLMTGNTTQAALDAVDLIRGAEGDSAPGGSRPLCTHATRNHLVRCRTRRSCRPLLLGRLLVPGGSSRRWRRDRYSQGGELKIRRSDN